jgi:hypothetical protein
MIQRLKEDAEGMVKSFDGTSDSPELVWDSSMRTELRRLLASQLDKTLSERQDNGGYTSEFTPDSSLFVRYSSLENEVFIGGVYVSRFLKEPTYNLRDPTSFLELLLQRWTKELDVFTSKGVSKAPTNDSDAIVAGGPDVLELVTTAIVYLCKVRDSLCDRLAPWGYMSNCVSFLEKTLENNLHGTPLLSIVRLLHVAVGRMANVEALSLVGYTDGCRGVVDFTIKAIGTEALHKDSAFMIEMLKKVYEVGLGDLKNVTTSTPSLHSQFIAMAPSPAPGDGPVRKKVIIGDDPLGMFQPASPVQNVATQRTNLGLETHARAATQEQSVQHQSQHNLSFLQRSQMAHTNNLQAVTSNQHPQSSQQQTQSSSYAPSTLSFGSQVPQQQFPQTRNSHQVAQYGLQQQAISQQQLFPHSGSLQPQNYGMPNQQRPERFGSSVSSGPDHFGFPPSVSNQGLQPLTQRPGNQHAYDGQGVHPMQTSLQPQPHSLIQGGQRSFEQTTQQSLPPFSQQGQQVNQTYYGVQTQPVSASADAGNNPRFAHMHVYQNFPENLQSLGNAVGTLQSQESRGPYQIAGQYSDMPTPPETLLNSNVQRASFTGLPADSPQHFLTSERFSHNAIGTSSYQPSVTPNSRDEPFVDTVPVPMAPPPQQYGPTPTTGSGIDARSSTDPHETAEHQAITTMGAPGAANGRVALLRQALTCSLCDFLVNRVLENPALNSIRDPASAQVHSISLLKLLVKDPGFGPKFKIILDDLPAWKRYKSQDHSLLITGHEQKADYFLTDGGSDSDKKLLTNSI